MIYYSAAAAALYFAWLPAVLFCLSTTLHGSSAFDNRHHHSHPYRRHHSKVLSFFLTKKTILVLRNDSQRRTVEDESFLLSSMPMMTKSFCSTSRRQLLQQTTVRVATATAAISGLGTSWSLPVNAAYIDPTTTPLKITDRIYLDVEWTAAVSPSSAAASLLLQSSTASSSSSLPPTITTNNSTPKKQQGRIVIGLYGEAMPKTVENFVTLCRQNAYQGTTFYRIISDYSIQGGAIGDTSNSGLTGKSSFFVQENNNGDGRTAAATEFEPDNFNIKHTKKGLVSMVKSKSGGVDSRFFIQLQEDAGWADDRYAAFGIVLDSLDDDSSSTTTTNSMAVVEALEKVPVQPPKNNPKEPVTIVASGVLS